MDKRAETTDDARFMKCIVRGKRNSKQHPQSKPCGVAGADTGPLAHDDGASHTARLYTDAHHSSADLDAAALTYTLRYRHPAADSDKHTAADHLAHLCPNLHASAHSGGDAQPAWAD